PGKADLTGSLRERLLGEDALLADQSDALMVDRSRKGDFGFERKGDRTVALKGDRLGPSSQPDGAPDGQRQALALPQPAPPPSPAPPVPRPAKAAGPARRNAREPEGQGRYSLASAGDVAAVAPKRPPARSAARAPARGDREADAPSVERLAFASADVDPTLRAARLYFSIDP